MMDVFIFTTGEHSLRTRTGVSVLCLMSHLARGSDRRTNQIWASREDVNTVCFVDDNTNVLASGADDGIVKVSSQREEIDSS